MPSPGVDEERDRILRCFVAAPSLRLPAEGVLTLAQRERAAQLRVALLDAGVTIYASHRDDAWVGRSERSGRLSDRRGDRVPTAFRAMQGADLVFADVSAPVLSAGVSLELGWASALRRPVVLFMERPGQHDNLYEELNTVTPVLPIVYDPKWTPLGLRHVVLTAMDWSDDLSIDLPTPPQAIAV
jgi:nucleoside 2-deoxyribosyltransferase